MPVLVNDEQVLRFLVASFKQVCNYTAQKIWNENRELIRQIVYDSYTPKAYERTGEFQEAWRTDTTAFANKVRGELAFDPEMLTVNYEKFQHGSELNGPMTTYLAEVIYQGKAGPLFGNGPWRRKRNVWRALNEKLGKRRLQHYFEEGMRTVGLKYHRTKAQIIVERDDIKRRERK